MCGHYPARIGCAAKSWLRTRCYTGRCLGTLLSSPIGGPTLQSDSNDTQTGFAARRSPLWPRRRRLDTFWNSPDKYKAWVTWWYHPGKKGGSG